MSLRKHIPNGITSMNLICGLVGVSFAIRHQLDAAFYAMLLASVFDFLDGLAARALGAYSDKGKELDSLSDLISFGFLPGLMLSVLMQTYRFDNSLYNWFPLILTLFSAHRLAEFNVDERQTSSFLGLPTPAAALFSGALCCYCCYSPVEFLSTWVAGLYFVPVLTLCLCVLLVCEVPMFSLKLHGDDSRMLWSKRITLAVIFVAAAVFCLVAGHHWSLTVVLGLLFYILNNLVYAIFKV
jgi:CDP-diacylglycerol--serine O-phosphatidyltransferase